MLDKKSSSRILLLLFPISFFILMGCKKDAGPVPECGVQLFDGENYKDDYANIDGSGSYSNLENLPNTDINWDDEADALKTGTSSTVVIWTKKNFQGDSVVFSPGSEEPSLDVSMRSMKISCQ